MATLRQIEALRRRVDTLAAAMAAKKGAYLTAERRREMILDAIRQVMDEHGAEGVTIEAVANRCPIRTSPSLVKHYFPGGKEGLIEAATTRKHTAAA